MRTIELLRAAGEFAACVVAVAAIAILACSSTGSTHTTAPLQGVIDTPAAPTATPISIVRPLSVPNTARLVSGTLDVGDQSPSGMPSEARHILYAVRCTGDVLVVSTTKETLYAELPCAKALPDEVFRQYLSQPVLIRLDDGNPRQLHLSSGAVGTLGFPVGEVWLLTK